LISLIFIAIPGRSRLTDMTDRYMECYRRAMLPEQTFEGRHENLNQANKLSRTFAALIEALDRHRGKGQQRITVEHVNVHPGWTGDRGGGQLDGWEQPKIEGTNWCNARNYP